MLRLNVPVNNFSVMSGRSHRFLGINQYFRGVKCLAQGHNTAAVGLEPRTSRSGVRHSTTEPPRSPLYRNWLLRSIVRTLNVKTVTTCTRLTLKKHSVVRTLNEPRQEKTCPRGFATRYDSNRPAQRHKLARVLKFRTTTRGVILSRQQTTKTLSDQIGSMRRLICIHIVHIWHKRVFACCGSNVKMVITVKNY